jgi:putative transposase
LVIIDCFRPEDKPILSILISKEINMFVVAERFYRILSIFEIHLVSTDGGGTWYPMACQIPKLNHHTHSPFEKSIIERTMQYVKDWTECLDETSM